MSFWKHKVVRGGGWSICGTESNDRLKDWTCSCSLSFQCGHDSHGLFDKRRSSVLALAEFIIVNDDDRDQTELFEVHQASSNALEPHVGERALDFNKGGAPDDWIENRRDDGVNKR